MNNKKQTLVIVTGLSGAGMSTYLDALQDMGFETHENFPLKLVKELLNDDTLSKPVAVTIDARSRGYDKDTIKLLRKELKSSPNIEPHLVLLHASENVLLRRYSETKRPHPMAIDRPVAEGIKQEMDMVMSLRAYADIVIDTSSTNVYDLREMAHKAFKNDNAHQMNVMVQSFGFKYGSASNADIMFDVRFMQNPHWVDDIKELPGTDKKVQEYVKADADYETYVQNATNLILTTLRRDNKSYIVIGVGCTGGRHRSVTVSEDITSRLKKAGFNANINHRDLDRTKTMECKP